MDFFDNTELSALLASDNEKYTALKKRLLEVPGPAAQKLSVLYAENNPLPSPNEIYNYYQLVVAASYGNDASKFNFDVLGFHTDLLRIENDSRVLFVNKSAILLLGILVHEYRIALAVLNGYCKVYHERGKEGNWVFSMIRDSLEYTSKRTTLNYKEMLSTIGQDAVFLPIHNYIQQLIDLYANCSTGVESAIKSNLDLLTKGNLRKLEQALFPDLYKTIFLVSEFTGPRPTLGSKSAIKKDLLFDVLVHLCPDRNWISRHDKNPEARLGDAYGGSYNKYRINTVTTILGK